MYVVANGQEETGGLITAASVMASASLFALTLLSMLLAAGLSFVFEKLPTGITVKAILVSLAFTVVEFLFNADFVAGWSLVARVFVSLAFIVSLIFLLFFLISFAHSALERLDSHLVMIHAVGIIPESTPTHRKHRLLRHARAIASTVPLFLVASMLVFELGLVPYFVAYLVFAIAAAMLYGYIAYQCRLREAMAATYAETSQDYIVGVDAPAMKVWEPGMPLPPMPVESHPAYIVHPAP
jgi:hypothetical protein